MIKTSPRRRILFLSFSLAAAFVLFAGCTNDSREHAAKGAVWKEDIAQAHQNNAALNAVRFSGSFAAEGLGDAVPALLAGGLRWEGFFQQDPALSEGNLIFGAEQGEQEPQKISFLMKNRMLYFHIPNLNQPEEFFMAELAETEAQALSGQTLISAATGLFDFVSFVVSEMNPEWIMADEIGASGPTPASSVYRILIHEKNREQASAAFQKGWNAWSAQVPALPSLASNGEKAENLANRTLVEGIIELTIDTNGFLIEQRADLIFDRGELHYSVSLTDMNETFKLERELPNQTLSFDHVLRFLAAGQQSEK